MPTGKLYSPEMKAQLALEALTKHNDAEICERTGLTPNMLTRWKHEVESGAISIFKGEDASAERMAEMERIIGRQVVNQELGKSFASHVPIPTNGKSEQRA